MAKGAEVDEQRGYHQRWMIRSMVTSLFALFCLINYRWRYPEISMWDTVSLLLIVSLLASVVIFIISAVHRARLKMRN